MSAMHGITRDDVYSVASVIFAQGKNPTQAAVRKQLGKGSYSTISKYLQEWRHEQQEAGVELGESQSVPEEFQKQMQRFYWGLRSNVELSLVSEQVELLEQENEQLRQRQLDYDALTHELAGLKYAYQETLARLEQVSRDNEKLEQRLKESLQSGDSTNVPAKTLETKAEPEPVKKSRQRKTVSNSVSKPTRSRTKGATKSVEPQPTWEQRVDSFTNSVG